ncbi:MAG: DUF1385 domain-containing protein [bacterium]
MGNRCEVGGQAVIEGVMMRNRERYAVVVRKGDGTTVTKVDEIKTATDRWKFLKLPVIRGMVMLVETLILGMKTLSFSADVALEEEEVITTPEGERVKRTRKGISNAALTGTMVLAVGIGVLLFVVLPLALTNGTVYLLNKYLNLHIVSNSLAFNLIDGIYRIITLVVYIFGISAIRDIQRVFQYHGAEHKSIYTYEAGEELTVENARKHSTLHPRCGTNFLMVVMVTSILVFSVLRASAPGLAAKLLWQFLPRLALIPLIAGVSWEFIKLAGRKSKNPLVRALIFPGLALQRVTTREPDDGQIEVALLSLKAVLAPLPADPRAERT